MYSISDVSKSATTATEFTVEDQYLGPK